MRIIGMVTIGQAPRADWSADLAAVLPPSVRLAQAGALDGMTLKEVNALDFAPGDNVLVTKMLDDTEVRVPEHHAEALINKRIKEMENAGIDLIYLACTWDFKVNPEKALIICPQKIVTGVLTALVDGKTLGLCVPDERQTKAAEVRYGLLAKRIVTVYCPPYNLDDVTKAAAEKLASEQVDFVLMDCMGYTKETGDLFREITGKPVLVPRILANRVISELI